jgi:hypothetical protein
MARRDPVSVGIRLLTRNGHNWASRYPLIVKAVSQLKVRSCLIDGEAVCCNEHRVPLCAAVLALTNPYRRVDFTRDPADDAVNTNTMAFGTLPAVSNAQAFLLDLLRCHYCTPRPHRVSHSWHWKGYGAVTCNTRTPEHSGHWIPA